MADVRRPRPGLAWFIFLALGLSGSLAAAAPADDAALHRLHDGGTLRLTSAASFGTIDPQVNYMLKGAMVFWCTHDGLTTFAHVNGLHGNDVVADLATELPQVTDAGRTYVFHLRQGVHFSTGRLLTTADVVATFVRLFKVQSPNAGSWYNVIVGGDDCIVHPDRCTLADGVIGDEAAHTVTFHLTHPDSEFLDKLAFPFGSIVPADTPAHDLGTTAAPGTGAYMVDSYDPQRLLRLKRNPYFTEFSVEAQPRGYADRIDYAFGLDNEAAVTAVINNQYDWMYDTKPLDRLTELGADHADRVHINLLPEIYYVPLNTNLPPFNNRDARLAVAYAVDRRAVVKLFGGTHMGTPFCQNVPQGIAGYAPYCPFTLNPGTTWTAPDWPRARDLMRRSGTAGMKVTLIVQDTFNMKAMGEYLRSLLAELGYDAKLKAISSQIQFNYIQNTNNKVQAALTDWTSDYPAASDYLQVLFSCANFHPGSDNSVNMSGLCDPATDRLMDHALAIEAADPATGTAEWARIDRHLTDQAAQVTLFQADTLDLLSARLGNFTWNPLMQMVFSRVWVQ